MPHLLNSASLRRLLCRKSLPGAISGMICGLLASVMFYPSALKGLDDRLFDECFSLRGTRATSSKLIVVGLDGFSAQQIGKPLVYLSPELATVVTFLKSQKAAAIGIDLIIPEELSGLAELEHNKQGDAAAMGNAVQEAGNVVLAHWIRGGRDRSLESLPQWRLKNLATPEVEDVGFVDTTPDRDQFIRRQLLALDENELHFAAALLKRSRPEMLQWHGDKLTIGGDLPPLDDDGLLRVNYIGPPGTVPVVRMWDVLSAARQRVKLDLDFRDAVVIIGDVRFGQHDYHATPFNSRVLREPGTLMAGPELLLNVYATLADRAWIKTIPPVGVIAILMMLGGAAGVGYSRLSLSWGFSAVILFFFGWKVIAAATFWIASLRLPIAPTITAVTLSYAATFAVRWYRVRNMFGVVKSNAIARALEASPEGLDLAGEDRVVTVLFCDIRSFTTYSEQHAPHEVVTLLNTYFSAIVPIIEKHGGALNQYMGDGIMVLFGAPERQADHARRAVATAVDIVRCVHAMTATWQRLDFPNFRIGVGIQTGRVVVGTVGSRQRLDYTAIGDTINTASRIEGETKRQQCEILVGESTFRELPRDDRRRLGIDNVPIIVKLLGREEVVNVYRVAADFVEDSNAAAVKANV
jgi:adenylate cyclase